MKTLVLPCLVACLLALCSCLTINEYSATLGSLENPVRCDGPEGERAYLSRLAGAEGEPVSIVRIGNYGTSPEGNPLDAYEIGVEGESYRRIIYMDLYHPGYREDRPIEGFALRETESE